jgi:hypothetical protein
MCKDAATSLDPRVVLLQIYLMRYAVAREAMMAHRRITVCESPCD